MKILPFILDTVARNLDFFAFEKDFSQSRFKRFSELAIFFHYASHDHNIRSCAAYTAIADYLGHEMERLSEDDIFKNFYTAYHLIMPYVFIRRFHRIPHLEEALKLVCEMRLFSPEIPPHRQMEWEYMLYQCGRKDSLAWMQDSVLTQSCYLPFIDRDLAYAMTHALFYLTDFGFHTAPPGTVDCDRTGSRVACLAARFAAEKDVDVMLELVIGFVALYPHMSDRRQADAQLANLLALAEGCLAETKFLASGNADMTEELLEKKYHTLFVLGILHVLLNGTGQRHDLPAKAVAGVFMHGDVSEPALATEENALAQAWRIIDSLRRKNYTADVYAEYRLRFGRSVMLEEEIRFYMAFLKRRNEANILWRQEFTALAVSPDRQQLLSRQSEQDLQEKMLFSA
jgi:hypothetical protein